MFYEDCWMQYSIPDCIEVDNSAELDTLDDIDADGDETICDEHD